MKSEYIELAAGISKVLDYRGKTPQKLGSDWVEQGVRVISAKNVHDGKLDNLDSIRCVTKEIYEKWMKEDIQRNDILLASEGASMGESMLWESDEKIVLGQRLFCLRCDSSVLNPYYLAMYMRTPEYQAELVNHATGTSVLGLRQPALLRTKVRYLPIESQNMIGNLYRVILARIDNNKKINDNLEQQARAYFQELFVDSSDSTWTLGTVSDLGAIVGGSTPSKAKPEYYTEDGIAWITPRDLSINKAKFISHGENDITELGLKNSSASIMPEGTVLFSSRAPIGYIAIASGEVTTNQGFKSVVPKPEIGTAYVYYFLKHNLPVIEGMASGSTFKEVSGSTMKNVPAVIPDTETLSRFNDFCAPIFIQQRILEEQNQSLAALRDSLLPKLMSGELDVSGIQL